MSTDASKREEAKTVFYFYGTGELKHDEKDTEDEGDHGSQGQGHPEVGHPVVEGSHGNPVGENTLQTHKQQPRWERHPGSHVVQRLGVINLSNPHSR